MTAPETIRFGPQAEFELDEARFELRRADQPVALEAKPFELLVYLVRHADRVVEKDELLDAVWPGTVVSEASLTTALRQIRVALDDDARDPRFIQTVRGRGYRWIAPIVGVEAEAPARTAGAAGPATQMSTAPGSRRVSVGVLGGALAGAVAAAIWLLVPRPIEGPPIRSIAVLPLQNLSGDASQGYFAAGITEDLIGALTDISTLRVASHRSVLRFKYSDEPLPEVARALEVDALIEGTVRREGDRVRITVQLVRGPEDKHLWHANYDEDLRDILDLQSRIARDVAKRVRATVASDAIAATPPPPVVVPAAYDAYLRGRHADNLGASVPLVLPEFLHAVSLDPEFADAHAWLAQTYVEMALYGKARPAEMLPKAVAHAERAVELGSPEGPIVLGWVALYYERDWAKARSIAEASMDDSPYARLLRGVLHCTFGEWPECHASLDQMERVDPFDFAGRAIRLGLRVRTRHYRRAIDELRTLQEIDMGIIHAYDPLYMAHDALGEYTEAVDAWERLWTLIGIDPSGPVQTFREEGYRAFVAAMHHAHEDLSFFDPIWRAEAHARLGEADLAFEWLDSAYRSRSPTLVFAINMNPSFDSIREDPRFHALAERLGIPVAEPDGPPPVPIPLATNARSDLVGAR